MTVEFVLMIGSVVIIMIATWLDVKRKQESGEYDDLGNFIGRGIRIHESDVDTKVDI